MTKKWFTLIELAIGIVVIWVGLGAIVQVLQYATTLTNTTKAEVVAINLAREWVETMFNIRDTNWKLYSSKKDQCWLSNTPVLGAINCETHPWINDTTRYYYIKSSTKNILYFTGENVLTSLIWQPLTVLEQQWNDSSAGTWYRMCYYAWAGGTTWESGYWETCNGTPDWVFTTRYWKYRRWIEIKGIYNKQNVAWGNLVLWCTAGNVGWACNDSSPKELRFCSRVDYEFNITRRVELCSAITNFEE